MRLPDLKTYISFALVIALSLVVCIVAFLLLADNKSMGVSLMWNFVVSFPLGLVVSFLDYKMIGRLATVGLFRHNPNLRIMSDWFATTAVGVLLVLVARHCVSPSADVADGVMTFVLWNSIVVLIIELFIYRRNAVEQEAALARMAKERADYQFEALKNQINPHFLFNSLNVLASLAYQDAAKTNLFAKKLSQVYRYLLVTNARQVVSLQEELDFLTAYLYLMQVRFGDAVSVAVCIPDDERRKGIVPVALQMLVENALKHNIATVANPLRIDICVSHGNVVVANNLQERDEVSASKVGLENLRKQYRLNGKDITATRTSETFVVTLPLL